MDNINNSSNINNVDSKSIPKNLPKKISPEMLRTRAAARPMQAPKPPVEQPQPKKIEPELKHKSIEELLGTEFEPKTPKKQNYVDNVVHKTDKQILKDYNKAVAYYRKAVRQYKRNTLKTSVRYKPVKNVFQKSIPDTLWFFERGKIKSILNKIDMTINYSLNRHKGVLTAIIVTILIMAVIATGVYLAFIITKNLRQEDLETVGEINLQFDGQGSRSSRIKNIKDARFNQDLEATPIVSNNTNVPLYIKFYITLEIAKGKDAMGVNIHDLTPKANINEEDWWVDSNDGVVYYLNVLPAGQSMSLFTSFQIKAAESLETAWQNKYVVATIVVDVCQVMGAGQEFPPAWSPYWQELIKDTY